MEISAGPVTPSRQLLPGGSGGTPNAKRPTSIQPATTPDGPLMDQATTSAAIYKIQHRHGPMEPWSVSVQDALVDHAGHIDHGRGTSTTGAQT